MRPECPAQSPQMKASDSSNSLNALVPSTPSCFICLEEDLVDGEPLISSALLRNCGCRFHTHPACWNKWMKDKSDYDCPICHKQSLLRIGVAPTPVLEEDPQMYYPKMQYVYILMIFGTLLGFAIYYAITNKL